MSRLQMADVQCVDWTNACWWRTHTSSASKQLNHCPFQGTTNKNTMTQQPANSGLYYTRYIQWESDWWVVGKMGTWWRKTGELTPGVDRSFIEFSYITIGWQINYGHLIGCGYSFFPTKGKPKFPRNGMIYAAQKAQQKMHYLAICLHSGTVFRGTVA